MSDINNRITSANGYQVARDVLVAIDSGNQPYVVVSTVEAPQIKVQSLIDGTLRLVDVSEIVALGSEAMPIKKGSNVVLHNIDGTSQDVTVDEIWSEPIPGTSPNVSYEWSLAVSWGGEDDTALVFLNQVSLTRVVGDSPESDVGFTITSVEAPSEDATKSKKRKTRAPKVKATPTFVNPAVMSAEELRQNALDRITKPGVISIAAGHGLIRVKSRTEDTVTGITATHQVIEVKFEELAPATKTQVDTYRELFKEVAKTLPTPLEVTAPVSLVGRAKKLLGYVASADVANNVYTVALVDGSDELSFYSRAELAPFAGKEPRFADVPLFGAFLFKGRTHVKVSKSNAIAVEVQGASADPVALLATERSKLGSAAFKRFKKDDRVQVYSPNLRFLSGSK